jgi:hypothetical protein
MMKIATRLTIFLALATTPALAQEATSTGQMQCQTLAEAGNYVGPNEIIVNGKVCKAVKVSPPQVHAPASDKRAQTSGPTPTTSSSATSSALPNTSASSSMTPVATSKASPPVQLVASHVSQPGCAKNVSFGVFENGRMFLGMPDWVMHWIQKNEKHYANICFSQTPKVGATNFLMVLSNSSQSLSGFDPVVRTNTTTSTTPVSGSGIVTDNYGGMWSYTYDGTVTTTTTTTTHENLAYSLNSNSLYIYTFDEHGIMVSERSKTLTTKQGGDPYNTLGYNLGAAFRAINFKSGLLKGAVKDVCGSKKCD